MAQNPEILIGFNNVHGFGVAKLILMKQLLQESKMDIIGVCETKRSDDHPIIEVHDEYNWIGKNRLNNRGGGIGFLHANHIVINN